MSPWCWLLYGFIYTIWPVKFALHGITVLFLVILPPMVKSSSLANTRRWCHVGGVMLGHRLRRWPSIIPPTLPQCLVFAERLCSHFHPLHTRCWHNGGLMLGQCLRCWPNIKPALSKGTVCATNFGEIIFSPKLKSLTAGVTDLVYFISKYGIW